MNVYLYLLVMSVLACALGIVIGIWIGWKFPMATPMDVDSSPPIMRMRWVLGIQNAVEFGHRMRHELAELGMMACTRH